MIGYTRAKSNYGISPRVSVVIPYYESAQWLEETLQSVFLQTYTDYETIVVDDGSKLQPVEQVLPCEILSKIRLLKQPNRGLAAARNRGIIEARGEYIVPLDADDLLRQTFIERCADLLDGSNGLGIAYTGFTFFGELNAPSRLQGYDYHLLLYNNFIPATAMFRKKAWKEVGGYKEDLRDGCEDWEFWIRLGKHGWHGQLIPQYLFLYRQRRNSMYQKAFFRQREIEKRIRELHPDLYAMEGMKQIESQWSEHKKFPVRFHYFLKRLFVNDFIPPRFQYYARRFYYILRGL